MTQGSYAVLVGLLALIALVCLYIAYKVGGK